MFLENGISSTPNFSRLCGAAIGWRAAVNLPDPVERVMVCRSLGASLQGSRRFLQERLEAIGFRVLDGQVGSCNHRKLPDKEAAPQSRCWCLSLGLLTVAMANATCARSNGILLFGTARGLAILMSELPLCWLDWCDLGV